MDPVDFRDLIRQLGGPSKFFKMLGVTYGLAKHMSALNYISPIYWEEVLEICEEEGITGVTPEWFMHLYSLKRGRWRRPKGGYYQNK